MPITCEEAFGSRTGERDSPELRYVLRGSDDDAALRTALLTAAPTAHNGLPRDDARSGLDQLGPSLWIGTVRYTRSDRMADDQLADQGDETFSFDTTGGTAHYTQAIAHSASYAPAGKTAPDHKGAIGVDQDGVAQGVDVTVAQFAFEIRRVLASSQMTTAYIGYLYAGTGTVNDAAWNVTVDGQTVTFQEGEVLFLGATATRRPNTDWELCLRFAATPNQTNVVVGDITVTSKSGWQYLWVEYERSVAGANTATKPKAAHVENVYEATDFADLEPPAIP